ncbi:bis-aminopropyl spermidine synthase family protein [Puia dinghuensis]|uniref:bis-aminopropyl spermidine synthase family protein n=1 Tax=Puia dinghuensis TaxID=1792502 RepID=UPI001662B074|nr:bis-aminopropyl spermidine synthase family protein [Puia dinghuensis]
MSSHINLREALNIISEVIINRPKPLREFDQIYMRAGDMLLQAEHVGRFFNDKNIVFIGDGDSIGLCLVHLHHRGILEKGPKSVHILDFDERIVLSIQHFAKHFGIADRISAELYNVFDPIPRKYWQNFDGFYSNPPFGASNSGRSVEAFLMRGIEATGKESVASVVIADDPKIEWTSQVLFNTQKFMLTNGFLVSELIPMFHSYHLDDDPGLKSCCISFRILNFNESKYSSTELRADQLQNFYGDNIPLTIRQVKDLTGGGILPSKDHEMINLIL